MYRLRHSILNVANLTKYIEMNVLVLNSDFLSRIKSKAWHTIYVHKIAIFIILIMKLCGNSAVENLQQEEIRTRAHQMQGSPMQPINMKKRLYFTIRLV